MKKQNLKFVVTALLFGVAVSLAMFLIVPLFFTLVNGCYSNDLGCILTGQVTAFVATVVLCFKNKITIKHILFSQLVIIVVGLLLVWSLRLLGVSGFWQAISSPLKSAFDWWVDVPIMLTVSALTFVVMVVALLSERFFHSLISRENSVKLSDKIIDICIYFVICAVLLFVICPLIFYGLYDSVSEGLITGLVLLMVFAFAYALFRDVNIVQLLICSVALFGVAVLLYWMGEVTQMHLFYWCAKVHGIGWLLFNFTGEVLTTSKIIGEAAFVAVLWFAALCVGTALRLLIKKDTLIKAQQIIKLKQTTPDQTTE